MMKPELALEQKFFSDLAERLTPKERLPLLDWARKNRRTEKGRNFTFRDRPYLKQIYADTHDFIVIKKAAQVGGTEFAISNALHFACEYSPVTIIYTFPTATEVRNFVAGRFNPSIAVSPYVKERIGRVDSVSVKEIAGSFLYLRGSFSDREALSVPADLLIHDEVDFSNQNILSQYEERLTASRYKKRLFFSTPTVPHFGIDALFEASDQHEWFVECESCGHGFLPQLEQIDKDKAMLRCPLCHKACSRRRGRWESMNPGAAIRGYHLDQLGCAFVDIESIIGKLEGPKKYDKRMFENFVRGQASAVGVGSVNRGIIMQRCFTDAVQRSESGRGRFMGIDQGGRLSVVISEVIDSKRCIVYMEEVEDDDDWSRMHRLMALHGVTTCVVDYRPEARAARRFAKQYPGVAWCCEFVTSDKELYFDKDEDYLVKGNRTEILDGAAEQIRDGRTQLYSKDEVVETYISHWERLARVEEVDRLGRTKAQWIKQGVSDLSFADAYNRLAVLIQMGDLSDIAPTSEVADTIDRGEGGSWYTAKW